MSEPLVFEGTCWKFGHNIPTDEITPTSVVWKSFSEMAKHVFESLNPEFAQKVQKGDIIVAGRNFGCSSGRAIAAKAIKATGVGRSLRIGSREHSIETDTRLAYRSSRSPEFMRSSRLVID